MTNYLQKAAVFLGLWLIASLVWSVWLDGIYVAILGCLTSLGVTGALNITFKNK